MAQPKKVTVNPAQKRKAAAALKKLPQDILKRVVRSEGANGKQLLNGLKDAYGRLVEADGILEVVTSNLQELSEMHEDLFAKEIEADYDTDDPAGPEVKRQEELDFLSSDVGAIFRLLDHTQSRIGELLETFGIPEKELEKIYESSSKKQNKGYL